MENIQGILKLTIKLKRAMYALSRNYIITRQVYKIDVRKKINVFESF